jgi:hypothetical protein
MENSKNLLDIEVHNPQEINKKTIIFAAIVARYDSTATLRCAIYDDLDTVVVNICDDLDDRYSEKEILEVITNL